MTPEKFVIWLKGFAQAANNFTLTPKQWDDLKEHLESVKSESEIKELIKKYPNDTELGKEIRKIYK